MAGEADDACSKLRLGARHGGVARRRAAVREAGAMDAMRLVVGHRREHEHEAAVQLRDLYPVAQLLQQVLHLERQRHGGAVRGHVS